MNRWMKIIAAAAVVLGVAQADAAVTGNNVITPQTPNRGTVQFLQGTDSPATYKTLYTAGANGSRCNAIWSTNNDASANHLVTVQLYNGTAYAGGVAVTSAESAGYANGTPAQNLMTSALWPGLPNDSDGNPYIQLASGDTLRATFATALTSSDYINIVASCSDF
jgi:hypothetical protein